MKKKLPILILMAILVSCNPKEHIPSGNSQYTNPIKPSGENTVSLHLQPFDFPEEINGCSCYFSRNKEDFQAGKYIFADDMGKSTYLKINGKMITIPKTDDHIDPENFSKHIKDSQFDITLKGKKANGDQEALIIEGIITVKDRTSGAVYKSPFYGECGC